MTLWHERAKIMCTLLCYFYIYSEWSHSATTSETDLSVKCQPISHPLLPRRRNLLKFTCIYGNVLWSYLFYLWWYYNPNAFSIHTKRILKLWEIPLTAAGLPFAAVAGPRLSESAFERSQTAGGRRDLLCYFVYCDQCVALYSLFACLVVRFLCCFSKPYSRQLTTQATYSLQQKPTHPPLQILHDKNHQ